MRTKSLNVFDEAAELVSEFNSRGGKFAEFAEQIDNAFYGISSTEIMLDLSFALSSAKKGLSDDTHAVQRIEKLLGRILKGLKESGIV